MPILIHVQTQGSASEAQKMGIEGKKNVPLMTVLSFPFCLVILLCLGTENISYS